MSANTADQGHLKRLDALERQLTHHRDIVDALRTRLQRLKPAGQSTPPKARRHHRHTRSDPTPQPVPAPSTPSPRPSQRRSHGKSGQRKGGHGKSRSVQAGSIQGQNEHLVPGQEERVVEEDNGFGVLAKHSALSFPVLDDARVGGALGRCLETESSGGGTAERMEDGSGREESIAGAAARRRDNRWTPSDSLNVGYPTSDAVKTSPPPSSPVESDGSTRGPTREGGTSQEHSDNDGSFTSGAVPPSPLPRIVGEYPGADPGDEKRESRAELGESHYGRYWKYTFTAILPVSMRGIRVRSTDLTIEDRPP